MYYLTVTSMKWEIFMSLGSDREPQPYDEYGMMPHPDDVVWIDAKGKQHYIPEMDIEYVEAVIRFLNNKGFKNEIPKALFKRYNERHKIVIGEFDEL